MKKTALNEIHRTQGARMVEFAGYDMPVQYCDGMLKEHEWVRSGAVGIFDVSHMGQFIIEGSDVSSFLSYITPTNFALSSDSLAKYTVLTNPQGGIVDDLIITKLSEDKFFIVLNAGCKDKDEKWIRSHLPSNLSLTELSDRSLIAVQGALAEEILSDFFDDNLSELGYMRLIKLDIKFGDKRDWVFVSRTGYTGEDGFEISIKNSMAGDFWVALCANSKVKPIGLGARDSLRLEMGYPLYGHDLDDQTSPIEAGISWVASKNHENFIGCDRIIKEKSVGSTRKRLGLKLLDRGVAREGIEIKKNGRVVGVLTSGGFSPTLKISIGQGYFPVETVSVGDEVFAVIRDREVRAIITTPNFIEAKTKSSKK